MMMHSQDRIKKMCKTDPVGFRNEPKQRPIAIEPPRFYPALPPQSVARRDGIEAHLPLSRQASCMSAQLQWYRTIES
jgi:hypothetical protein